MRKTVTSILNWVSSYIAWRGLAGVPLFIRHQIQSRIGSERFTVHDPNAGTVVLRKGSSDLHVFRQVLIQGEYRCPPRQDKQLRARYEAILATGKTPLIVDAGANIGLFARYIASQFPKAHIACIEPDTENMRIVKENCANLPMVSFKQAALWKKEGYLKLSDPNALPWALSYEESDPDADNVVSAVTFDQVIASVPNAVPFLLKIDIEGAEREALPADAAFWTHRPVLFIEPHDELSGVTGSLRGIMHKPEYHNADYVLSSENLLVFPQ